MFVCMHIYASFMESINMGYWPNVRYRWLDIRPSSFCVFMDLDGHNLTKKERDQYRVILTEQPWLIKDLLYGFRGNVSCGTRRVVPSGQDSFTYRGKTDPTCWSDYMQLMNHCWFHKGKKLKFRFLSILIPLEFLSS